MKVRSVKTRLLKRLNMTGADIEKLSPIEGIEAMLSFYEEERVDGCDPEDDGDMLRFEWGTYDWGDGGSFQVSVTRQLMATDDDEDEPQQLKLTFKFDPAVGGSVKDGGQWCESPEDMPKFRKYVSSSKAVKALGKHRPDEVQLKFGRV